MIRQNRYGGFISTALISFIGGQVKVKKILSIVLITIFVLSLTACGKDNNTLKDSPAPSASPAIEGSPDASSPDVPDSPGAMPTEEPVEKIDAEIIDGNAVISITLNDTVQLFTYYYDGDTLKSADLVTTLKTEDLAQTYATTIVASGLYQNPRVEGNKVTVDFTQDYLATFSLLTKEEIIDMHISMNSEE
jgi:uncharacterized lipoprotein YehR (DUF1307 family)